MDMKRFYSSLIILALQLAFCPLWAQNDDIEVTDSTSTDWEGGSGGGLNPQTPTGLVTTLTLSHNALTLAGGESVQLTAKVNSDAANKTILWSSADTNIASVSNNGQVFTWGKGSTTITATAAGNNSLKQTCTVTVTSNPLLHGDVNDDGEITAQDASLIQQYVARKFGDEAEGFRAAAADVNGDGDVTAQDASLVQQYAARKITW